MGVWYYTRRRLSSFVIHARQLISPNEMNGDSSHEWVMRVLITLCTEDCGRLFDSVRVAIWIFLLWINSV